MIEACVRRVAGNKHAIAVASLDFKIVDLPILLVEELQNGLSVAAVDRRRRTCSVSVDHDGGVCLTRALRGKGSVAKRAALQEEMIARLESECIRAHQRIPRRNLSALAVLAC